MSRDFEKLGIKVNQIYIAADGSFVGHLVTDVETFAECDDVVTTPFSRSGWKNPGNRIDAFKLARVRYELVGEAPDWMPTGNIENYDQDNQTGHT